MSAADATGARAAFPRYVAVEGVIGVGKTSLARLLAERFGARLVLEAVEENPFLAGFYDDMEGNGFRVQIFFLLSRHRQQQELARLDLFDERVVSDYLFQKDTIFAHMNLVDEELALYRRLLPLVERDVPRPDLVIHLRARTETLMRRIARRARSFEIDMPEAYIAKLAEAYQRYFQHYDETPLLVVDTESLNFVDRPEDFERLVEALGEPGRRRVLTASPDAGDVFAAAEPPSREARGPVAAHSSPSGRGEGRSR